MLVLGPTDEDPDYYADCRTLVKYLGLEDTVEFKGPVNLADYLGGIDVVVLTSLSEAQPLVILEAGAAGLPMVATDVGACREMILGRNDERPALGPGGAITPLCNPSATAQELASLLTDRERYDSCSRAIRERTRTHYNKNVVDRTYRELYEKHIRREAAWPA
jgi:glycosyltransferase involved in cell wall biosynthesis